MKKMKVILLKSITKDISLNGGMKLTIVISLSLAMLILAGVFLNRLMSKSPEKNTSNQLSTVESIDKKETTAEIENNESKTTRIIFLHHSTGEIIWNGGVLNLVNEYNKQNGTDYRIHEQNYPSSSGGYPWNNYPYDYYNLWVKHKGDSQDRKELNLDQIAASYDVIIFKHCYPVSEILEDTGKPNINSERKSLENYKLQYNALKERLLQFPNKKFIVWTGAALAKDNTNSEQAKRAKEWSKWVLTQWDTPMDNIFVWDFESLETEGELYLKYPSSKTDSHPDSKFAKAAAPDLVRKIIEVIKN